MRWQTANTFPFPFQWEIERRETRSLQGKEGMNEIKDSSICSFAKPPSHDFHYRVKGNTTQHPWYVNGCLWTITSFRTYPANASRRDFNNRALGSGELEGLPMYVGDIGAWRSEEVRVEMHEMIDSLRSIFWNIYASESILIQWSKGGGERKNAKAMKTPRRKGKGKRLRDSATGHENSRKALKQGKKTTGERERERGAEGKKKKQRKGKERKER